MVPSSLLPEDMHMMATLLGEDEVFGSHINAHHLEQVSLYADVLLSPSNVIARVA